MKNLNKLRIFLLSTICLTACNSVYMKPNTLDTSQVFYADRGGYTMRRAIKEQMGKRGYKIVVGSAKSSENIDDSDNSIDIDKNIVPNNAKYIVKTKERKETFRPIWCAFNGFWWWNFNISIADQQTGSEILSWAGRGCVNSSIRKLDKILDNLEISEN